MMKAPAAVCAALLAATPLAARAQSADSPPTPPPEQLPPPAPAEPPPPPDGGALAPPSDAQSSSDGQWIYTTQYGWVYAPYGAQYTAEGESTEEDPWEYVYNPSSGWMWLAAPWGLYSFQGGTGLTHGFHGGGFGVPDGSPHAVTHGSQGGFSEHGSSGGHGFGGGHGGGGHH